MRLGNICSKIGSGATPRGGKESYLQSGEYSLIRSQNILNNVFSYDGLAFISHDQADQLKNVIVEDGDVLLNITGDSVARVCQAPSNILPARVNQHVAIIRPDPQKLNKTFLRYFLVSPKMQSYMLAMASAGATRNALTKGMIEAFEAPDFPLNEQRAIASILGALDDKIENNRAMNETLEEMARAIFKSWFVDFDPVHAKSRGEQPAHMDAETAALFPDRFGDDGLPEGWRWGTLNDIANLNVKSHSSRNHPPHVWYADLANTKNGTIEKLDFLDWKDAPSRARRIVTAGDTLVGTVRPGNRSFAFVGDFENPITASTGFAVLTPNHPKHREFVYLSSTSSQNIERLTHLADGAAYPAVRPNVVSDTDIPIAGTKMFDLFHNQTSDLLDLRNAQKTENKTLAELRDTLLPKLMSGEIRIKDAERQVGAAV